MPQQTLSPAQQTISQLLNKDLGAYGHLGLQPGCTDKDADVSAANIETTLRPLLGKAIQTAMQAMTVAEKDVELIKARNRIVGLYSAGGLYQLVPQSGDPSIDKHNCKCKWKEFRELFGDGLSKLLGTKCASDGPLEAVNADLARGSLLGRQQPPPPNLDQTSLQSQSAQPNQAPPRNQGQNPPQSHGQGATTHPAPATGPAAGRGQTLTPVENKLFQKLNDHFSDPKENLSAEHRRLGTMWKWFGRAAFVLQWTFGAVGFGFLMAAPGEFLSGMAYRAGGGMQIAAAMTSGLIGLWIGRAMVQRCTTRRVFDPLNAFHAHYHNWPDMRSSTLMMMREVGKDLQFKPYYDAVRVLLQITYAPGKLNDRLKEDVDVEKRYNAIKGLADRMLKKILETQPENGAGDRIFPRKANGQPDDLLREDGATVILPLLKKQGVDLEALAPMPYRYGDKHMFPKNVVRGPASDARLIFKTAVLAAENCGWWEREELNSGRTTSVQAVKTMSDQIDQIVEKEIGKSQWGTMLYNWKHMKTATFMYYARYAAAASFIYGGIKLLGHAF